MRRVLTSLLDEPATGRLVSIPAHRRPLVNDLFVRRGRWIEPGRPDEVLASEGFVTAHGLQPGDSVPAVINGRLRRLRIVGVALSPEYVYSIRPGELVPDDRRFGIFWMDQEALGAAFDMEGGFNDVVLTLGPGASVEEAADAFGVPARTVRRDLAHLDFCGLPGLGGGALFDVTIEQDRVVVSMADELRRPLRLTPREALRLVLSLQAVDHAFGDELPALRSAIGKVRDAAGLPEAAAVAVEEGLPAGGWLPVVRTALRAGQQLRLTYQGRADAAPRQRLIDPWQLDVTSDGWYLHGHDVDAGGHRVFRLDRVVTIEPTTQPISVPRPAEPLPEPRFEPIDLTQVVRDAAKLHEPGRCTVSFTTSGEPLSVSGDRLLLSRAVHNLLLNAAEASPDGGTVVVRSGREGDDAVVEVLDRGSGLAPEVRTRLFEPYVSTKARGSGLGLSLVRDIAVQHGGTVTLDDREDGGARACLRLPVLATPHPKEGTA